MTWRVLCDRFFPCLQELMLLQSSSTVLLSCYLATSSPPDDLPFFSSSQFILQCPSLSILHPFPPKTLPLKPSPPTTPSGTPPDTPHSAQSSSPYTLQNALPAVFAVSSAHGRARRLRARGRWESGRRSRRPSSAEGWGRCGGCLRRGCRRGRLRYCEP
jgi:hypothetical protein